MFDDVDGETDGGGLQPLAANFPDDAEVGRAERAENSVVLIERPVDNDAQLGSIFVTVRFGRDDCNLLRSKLFPFQIRTEPQRASSQVFGLKTGAGEAVNRRPKLRDSEIADGLLHVFPQMLAAMKKVANNRIKLRVNASKPWLWL